MIKHIELSSLSVGPQEGPPTTIQAPSQGKPAFVVQRPSPVNLPVYKMGFVSNSWTPMAQTRMVRDVLLVQRLAVANRVSLLIASNVKDFNFLDGITDVKTTGDLMNCKSYRLYVDHSVDTEQAEFVALGARDLIPDPDAECEVIEINNKAHPKSLIHEKDPYAGVPLQDGYQHIPDTLPIDKPAPHGKNDEPTWSPFL